MHFNGTARPPCGQDASGPAHAGGGGDGPSPGRAAQRRGLRLPAEKTGRGSCHPTCVSAGAAPPGAQLRGCVWISGPGRGVFTRGLVAGPPCCLRRGLKRLCPGSGCTRSPPPSPKGPQLCSGRHASPDAVFVRLFFFFSFLRGKVICQHLGIVRISELNYICHMTFLCLPRLTIKNEDYGAGARFITPRVTSVTECFASL